MGGSLLKRRRGRASRSLLAAWAPGAACGAAGPRPPRRTRGRLLRAAPLLFVAWAPGPAQGGEAAPSGAEASSPRSPIAKDARGHPREVPGRRGAQEGTEAEPEAPPDAVSIPGACYRLGSDARERALGYALAPSLVERQRWYDAWERPPHEVEVEAFRLARTPATQRDYAAFVRATGHRVPYISRQAYREQGFLVHPYATVESYLWREGEPPTGREEHPVVLVSRADAAAYCAWRGGRLPRERQWEAACRGRAGRLFPWGDRWQADHAHVGAEGTAAVGSHPGGTTPEGVQELAGNVFEWTRSGFGENEASLRSCSWDDAPGTCRCAFRHGRPPESRHVLIGFRCAFALRGER